MNKFLEAALEYAEAGLPVFPLVPGKKNPLIVGGFKAATTDSVIIIDWWERCPDANIGIPMGAVSGIVGLDIDYKDGCALDFLSRIPHTAIQNSPSGGHHAFFRYPEGGIKNGKKLEMGVTVRGDGYYFAVAPSHFMDGVFEGDYTWTNGGIVGGAIEELPEWMLKVGAKPSKIVIKGERHDALTKRAVHLRKIGEGKEKALAALVRMNARFPDGPKPADEIMRALDWAWENVPIADASGSNLSRDDIMFAAFPDENAKGVRSGTLENLKELLRRLEITVRYNMISKEEEILIPGEQFTIDNQANATLAHIISWCERCHIPTANVGSYVTTIADANIFNPVMTWIHSIPWDGISRLSDLYNTIKSPTIIKEVLIRKWLISAVAAACEPNGVSAHGVLVLQGEQYIGKTYWFKKLVPQALDLTADGVILRPDDKDSVFQCISKWLNELGELDATFNRSDMAQLKAFITKDKDILRRSYAKKDSSYARRTVFMASVNRQAYLTDDTGNRRFWTIECESINYGHTLDMQQVWAEVFALYRAGESWKLTKEENDSLSKENQDFITMDPIEERLRDEYDWECRHEVKVEECQCWIKFEEKRECTATDICKELGMTNIGRGQTTKVGSAIRKIFPQKTRILNGIVRFKIPEHKNKIGITMIYNQKNINH